MAKKNIIRKGKIETKRWWKKNLVSIEREYDVGLSCSENKGQLSPNIRKRIIINMKNCFSKKLIVNLKTKLI